MGSILSPLVAALALLAGCYKQVVYESSLPQMEAQTVHGPPGGGMDPGYGYQDPDGYGATYDGAAIDQNLTGTVTDAEIQTTLAPYGEWVEDPEYGWVWRPYATVVGADFTPYESCGQWVYTEFGWTWESCADWYWGWLAFHYGQWAYLDSGWCWVAGYDYSPAWVDWRYGGGHVGWRPTAPRGGRFRDHRDGRPSTRPGSPGGGQSGPVVRDHRRNKTPWTWVRETSFEAKNVRDHVVRNPRIRFESTTAVSRPPVPARSQLAAASLMRPRIQSRANVLSSQHGSRPAHVRPTDPRGSAYQPPRGPSAYQPRGPSTYQPGATYQPPRGSAYPPRGPSTYQPGSAYQPPRGPSAYQPRGPYQPSRPTYHAPSSSPPSRYSPPSAPSRSYSPPSAPSRSYSPPSTPSRSYSPPSAPSRSYSPPSRSSSGSSSSYSAPSRSSSSSYSAPSRSSSSSSSSRSSSSSSSSSRGSSGGGSSGGGRRR